VQPNQSAGVTANRQFTHDKLGAFFRFSSCATGLQAHFLADSQFFSNNKSASLTFAPFLMLFHAI
jgi:hypothetical protein